MPRTVRSNATDSGLKPFDSVVVCYIAKLLIQDLLTDRCLLEMGFISPHLSPENQLSRPSAPTSREFR